MPHARHSGLARVWGKVRPSKARVRHTFYEKPMASPLVFHSRSQVWLESGEEEGQVATVRHTFYEKPMASPLVFHSRLAYNWKAKVVTLSEEVKRRLMNMDLYHTEGERVEVLATFLKKMTNSQYGPPTQKEVLKSGIWRDYRKVYTGNRRPKAL